VENPEGGDRQFVTTSTDGSVAVWDLRFKKDLKSLDLTWRPFLRVPISSIDNSHDYSVTKISLRTTEVENSIGIFILTVVKKQETASEGENEKIVKPKSNFTTKFYAATEEGDLIYADWFAEKVSEEKNSRVEFAYQAHYGPMSDISRSPFFPDIILTTGGWSFHIWREEGLKRLIKGSCNARFAFTRIAILHD
jgi:WD40 repeat protein